MNNIVDSLVSELTVAQALLMALAPIAYHDEASTYLPFGLAERVQEWVRTNKAWAVIQSAKAIAS